MLTIMMIRHFTVMATSYKLNLTTAMVCVVCCILFAHCFVLVDDSNLSSTKRRRRYLKYVPASTTTTNDNNNIMNSNERARKSLSDRFMNLFSHNNHNDSNVEKVFN